MFGTVAVRLIAPGVGELGIAVRILF